MSGRGMQGSLSVQADRLKKTMQNRDQRRRKEQNQRAVRSALPSSQGVLVPSRQLDCSYNKMCCDRPETISLTHTKGPRRQRAVFVSGLALLLWLQWRMLLLSRGPLFCAANPARCACVLAQNQTQLSAKLLFVAHEGQQPLAEYPCCKKVFITDCPEGQSTFPGPLHVPKLAKQASVCAVLAT